MTSSPAYALTHILWETAGRFVPFSASAPTTYVPRTLIYEEELYATTARGAQRVFRNLFRDDAASIVAVYWSDKGRSIYVITKHAGRHMCHTLQPVHRSYAVYWDAETEAHGIAAMASVGKRYPVIARAFA